MLCKSYTELCDDAAARVDLLCQLTKADTADVSVEKLVEQVAALRKVMGKLQDVLVQGRRQATAMVASELGSRPHELPADRYQNVTLPAHLAGERHAITFDDCGSYIRRCAGCGARGVFNSTVHWAHQRMQQQLESPSFLGLLQQHTSTIDRYCHAAEAVVRKRVAEAAIARPLPSASLLSNCNTLFTAALQAAKDSVTANKCAAEFAEQEASAAGREVDQVALEMVQCQARLDNITPQLEPLQKLTQLLSTQASPREDHASAYTASVSSAHAALKLVVEDLEGQLAGLKKRKEAATATHAKDQQHHAYARKVLHEAEELLARTEQAIESSTGDLQLLFDVLQLLSEQNLAHVEHAVMKEREACKVQLDAKDALLAQQKQQIDSLADTERSLATAQANFEEARNGLQASKQRCQQLSSQVQQLQAALDAKPLVVDVAVVREAGSRMSEAELRKQEVSMRAALDAISQLIATASSRASSSARTDECVVCYNAPKSILLLPCRHMCVCATCVQHLGQPRKCPMCKAAVADVVQAFI